jgi:hypothetical protein
VLLRTEVDHVTGQLSDTRTRFLGTRPPKARHHTRGQLPACKSSRPQFTSHMLCNELLLQLTVRAVHGSCWRRQLMGVAPCWRFPAVPGWATVTRGATTCPRSLLRHWTTHPVRRHSCISSAVRVQGSAAASMCACVSLLRAHDILARYAGFASEQCPEGFVAVVKSSLRILMLDRLGETFNQTSVPLRYTPRGFAIDEANKVHTARLLS